MWPGKRMIWPRRYWLYPKNRPIRPYQYNMAACALRANTLVALPTGLGKTFVAAVVMLNFYRWFPEGKVLFVAPTKPLVKQQYDSCREIMGIPEAHVMALTGNSGGVAERMQAWKAGRVFFCTPQVVANDLKTGRFPGDEVVALVLDECHRAQGEYDYVRILNQLRSLKVAFRVLGLSATPGRDYNAEVIRTLGVRRVLYLDEGDPELAPYTHEKDTVLQVVNPLLETERVRELASQAARGPLAVLANAKAYNIDASREGGATTAGLAAGFKAFQGAARTRALPHPAQERVKGAFEQAHHLARVMDALDQAGHAAALDEVAKVQASGRKPLLDLGKDAAYRQMVDRLKATSGVKHPKMPALAEVLLQHFQEFEAAQVAAEVAGGGADGAPLDDITRAIVFCNNRELVAVIQGELAQHEPLIRASVFVGQGQARGRGSKKTADPTAAPGDGGGSGGGGAFLTAAAGGGSGGGGAGMNQKEQDAVLKGFRRGEINVLLATSIGEEGLDIPEVDLIVNFDTTSSPIRSTQRAGRTGRHRSGRVVYLLTRGREEERYRAQLEEGAKVKGCLAPAAGRGNRPDAARRTRAT
ncbi:Fanconi anemia, complementation group M [Monoraphidium neglectum]|uniref:Fanconi anemia, complementation group M n=1 Tax=Monoraphidium neglectum TaxID=145388 RepID=A0A0D2K945_9CHLO|nr:Fanconi anemia, complementation group M [Monoraphidium neglectum]KIZ06693.1 Fanconi anemia, complementation group M [Monoraphidium neglectum]|eukprot:XP_013905712.1 Fanconi anemia, complementation group M [Monoraphidium neglectum]